MVEESTSCSESSCAADVNPTYTAEDAIRCWILEHACKHNMEAVLSELCKMGPKACHALFTRLSYVSAIFPVLWYLQHSLLSANGSLLRPCPYNDDDEHLTHVINILRHIRRRTDVIPLEYFVAVNMRLGLIVALRSLQKHDEKKAAGYMNDFFPRWSADVMKHVVKTYRIREKEDLDKFRRTIGKSRRHIHRLLASATKRRVYFERFFQQHVNLFTDSLVNLLPNFFEECFSAQLPRTVIEYFFSGTEPAHKEPLVPPYARLIEFVERLKQLGADPSRSDLQGFFLNVLSKMPYTEQSTGCRQLDTRSSSSSSFMDSLNSFMKRLPAVGEFAVPATYGMGSPSDDDWIYSPFLGLSPRSRMRISKEYEEATKVGPANTSTKTAVLTCAVSTAASSSSSLMNDMCRLAANVSTETAVHPMCAVAAASSISSMKTELCHLPENASTQTTVPTCAVAAASSSSSVRNESCYLLVNGATETSVPKCAVATTSSSSSTKNKSRSLQSFSHLPPKKRGAGWFKAGVIPTTKRQRLQVKLRQITVMKFGEETFEVFA